MDAANFSKHIDQINTAGFTSMLLSLGTELGLFDLMIRENRPMTSLELADIAGMKERYVREWLGGAAAGKLVTYDPKKKTFFIPETHHDALKGPALWSFGIVALSTRMEEMKKCFMKDGPYGIDFDNDDIFWKWYGGLRKKLSEDHVYKSVVPNLRNSQIVDKLESGISVLDACSGSGDITLLFAKLFPKSTFTGLELFEKPRALAMERAKMANLTNVNSLCGDVQNISDDLSDTYDMAMIFDSLHDLPDPFKALSEIHKVLKPDGNLIIVDFGVSSNLEDNIGNLGVSMLYSCSIHCCLPSSLTTEPRVGYGTCWGRQNIEAALKEKFKVEEVVNLSPMIYLFICTK